MDISLGSDVFAKRNNEAISYLNYLQNEIATAEEKWASQ